MRNGTSMTRLIFVLLMTVFSLPGMAQLCQGSLGDPLVNITFGTGNNPGAPLAAAATGYQYVANDCPNDGFYTVRNSSSSCFGNTWHNLNSDHTANGNGYFMLVNASIQPSAFYVDTVRGLCGNSTYEFAAWIMNVILPSSCNGNTNQPNLTFTIERTNGTVLQTYNSGNIPPLSTPVWKQYGFFFTTPPAGADIVLRIVNNAPGGCGNDLALDDITFRPCGPQLTPTITGQTTTTAQICTGTARSVTLNCSVSPGFVNPVFQWQRRFNASAWTDIAGATTLTYAANFPAASAVGNYEFRLTVAESGNMASPQCRISSTPISIVVNALPVAVASNNGAVCTKGTLMLTASGGTSYAWAGPNAYSSLMDVATIANIQPAQAGVYNLTVTNAAGCTATSSTTVVVNPAPIAAVASAKVSVCFGDSAQLSANGGTSYEWIPATGLSNNLIANPKASPAASTSYSVVVSNAFGCKDTANAEVEVFTKAIANAGPDKVIIGGGTATLTGSISGTYQSFAWTPAAAFSLPQTLQPAVRPTADATYRLTVESNNGCGTSFDDVAVKLYKGIFIPSAFSPNNDAINDQWNIPALEAYPNFELFVFNRYGEVVFKASKTNKPWDGRFKSDPLPAGAYIYLIKLNVNNQQLKGTVMLIR